MIPSISFHAGDAAFPRFSQHSFDGLVCRHAYWALPDPQAVLERWVRLLKPHGRLVSVEGFWYTEAGLKAQDLLHLLPVTLTDVQVQNLRPQAVLWGRTVTDERYAMIGQSVNNILT